MYAQILKESMKVDLIGDEKVGLPIEHQSVICIDLESKDYGTVEVEIGRASCRERVLRLV